MRNLGCRRARQLLRLAIVALATACAAAAPPSSDPAGAVPSCASKLVPCGGYLNTTAAPPASCCGPLKEAAASETACMCSILMNKAALRAFGVAPEQGLLLAKRCGVATDASACAKSAAATGAVLLGLDQDRLFLTPKTTSCRKYGAATAGSTAASSAFTGNAASTVAKPTASGGAAHHPSLIGASSLLVGFSFIWWTILA